MKMMQRRPLGEIMRREKMADQLSLRQRIDGGTVSEVRHQRPSSVFASLLREFLTDNVHNIDSSFFKADRLTRDPIRYMKNPSKIESDQIKYDARPVDAVATTTTPSDRPVESKKRGDGRATKPEPKETKADHGGSGFDKQLLKEDSLGHECCFFERRLKNPFYMMVSPDDNINLLKQEAKDESNSSQMDFDESMNIEESIEEIDMEDDTEEIAERPMKSVLKSSLRNRNAVGEMSEEENTGTVNPRRVLFGANTNVVYTNELVNTSTASSQLNGSFVKEEETINTKLANAEISSKYLLPYSSFLNALCISLKV